MEPDSPPRSLLLGEDVRLQEAQPEKMSRKMHMAVRSVPSPGFLPGRRERKLSSVFLVKVPCKMEGGNRKGQRPLHP